MKLEELLSEEELQLLRTIKDKSPTEVINEASCLEVALDVPKEDHAKTN